MRAEVNFEFDLDDVLDRSQFAQIGQIFAEKDDEIEDLDFKSAIEDVRAMLELGAEESTAYQEVLRKFDKILDLYDIEIA